MARRIPLVIIIIGCLIWANISGTMAATNLPAEGARKSQDVKKIDPARIPLNEEFVIGEKNAEKRVIIFTDPD